MRVGARDSGLTNTQRWWREKRLPEVEETAYRMVQTYEAKHGRRPGCVFPPELLVPHVGCDLVYFAAEERREYGIPSDAIGALLPTDRLIYVLQDMVSGREWHTIGEEVGHKVLHCPGSPGPGQCQLDLDVPEQTRVAVFTRTPEGAYQGQKVEPPWMTIEASLFSACVQMPKDRYFPTAERRFKQVLASLIATGRGKPTSRTPEERAARARPYVKTMVEHGWPAGYLNVVQPGLFDSDAVEAVLQMLWMEHQGKVSKAAQKRRFVELGLVHDAADLLLGPDGKHVLPRSEFFFVSPQLAGAALAGRQLG